MLQCALGHVSVAHVSIFRHNMRLIVCHLFWMECAGKNAEVCIVGPKSYPLNQGQGTLSHDFWSKTLKWNPKSKHIMELKWPFSHVVLNSCSNCLALCKPVWVVSCNSPPCVLSQLPQQLHASAKVVGRKLSNIVTVHSVGPSVHLAVSTLGGRFSPGKGLFPFLLPELFCLVLSVQKLPCLG